MHLRLGLLPLLLTCLPPTDGFAATPPAPTALAARATGDATPVPSPIELSDPDGQALTLTALTAKVAVEGPLSLTELELRFRNPQARRIEGRFTLTLPDGATISRFAKEVDGRLVEGEVVEREAAHRAYDAILHQMRDPALLEQDAGNRFSAKVFPIEPNAEVRIVLSYTRLLHRDDGQRAYTLPLRGLPTIGSFSFHGRFSAFDGETSADLPTAERSGDGVQHLDVVRSNWAPDADIAVRWRSNAPAGRAVALRSGDYYVAAFAPKVAVPTTAPARWSFYVDTSASTADGIAPRIAGMEAVLRALPAAAPVTVRAFDQDVALLAEGRAADVAATVGDALRARGFAGGTDLSRVLDDIAKGARPDTRVVLATDGVATFGDTNPAHLAAAAHALPAGVTLHALVFGAEQDGAVLAGLTEGRGRVVEVPFTDALATDAAAAAARLALPPGTRFDVADPNAAWVHAAGAGDVLPGGEVIVFGRVASGKEPAPRLLRAPGAGVTTSHEAFLGLTGPLLAAGDAAPLVEREAVRAHLADLALQEAAAPSAEAAATLAAEEVRLSVEHRVLCPKTTLLVLESDADYARFGLDRRALADILTVGERGIALVARAAPAWGQAPVDPPAKPELEATRKESKSKKTGESIADSMDGAADMDALARTANGDEASPEGSPGSPAEAAAPAPPPSPQPQMEPETDIAAAAKSDVGSADTERDDRGPVAREERPAAPGSAMASVASGAPAPRRGARASRPDGSGRNRPPEPTQTPAPPPDAGFTAPDWVQPVEIASTEMDALEAAVATNPRDREPYNHLADALFATQRWDRLAAVTRAWQPYDPDNPHVYEMMGEAAFARGDLPLARRAFGSPAEVAAGKPELLQRAGLLLWRAGDPAAAEVPLRRALELRPDRVNSHRHLALVLRATGRFAEAAEVLEGARAMAFPSYYQGIDRVLGEELAAVYRDWIVARPAEAAAVRERATRNGADLARTDRLRVTLAWETDGNDVDLHVVDPRGEECFYGHRNTGTGLELYEDLTQGLGPEVIRGGEHLPGGRYTIGVKYFSAGPMGVSRGLVVVEEPGQGPRVVPFRLVEGGRDLRLVATVDLPAP
jgi:Flp pilus assembly protein TadD